MDLSVYYYILARRKWMIIITTLVVAVIVAVGSLRTPTTYEAVTRLRVVPYSLGAPDYGSYIYFDRLANTYSDIVNSETVIEQAKDELGMAELPDFTIEVIPQTELMRLSVVAETPQLAREVANTLARLLIEQNQVSYTSDSGVQATLSERINTLETQINDLTVQYAELSNQVPRDNERLTEVRRTLDSLQQNYNLLLNNANQAAIAEIARANALSVAEPAHLPTEPVGPNVRRNVLLGAVLGLVAGIGLAFLMETFNPQLYTDQQVEQAAQAPIIARVPAVRRASRRDLITADHVAGEAFRRLRTHLFAELNQDLTRFLLVTSAVPNEGKSTVAANLAQSIAFSGRSVLLIDGDMLRPSLHETFKVSNLAGLSTVLQGKSSLTDSVRATDANGPNLLCAGPLFEGAAELLGSDAFYQMLDEALKSYEVVVFDSPAVLAAADALMIAKQMNSVLWVIDREKVDRDTIVYAQQQLQQVGAQVLGVVANRVRNDKNAFWERRYKPRTKAAKMTVKAPTKTKSVEGFSL